MQMSLFLAFTILFRFYNFYMNTSRQIGLQNLGLTCFISTPLQVFYSIVPFRMRLLVPTWEISFLPWDTIEIRPGFTHEQVGRARQVVEMLRGLFMEMRDSQTSVRPTREFMSALRFQCGGEVDLRRLNEGPDTFTKNVVNPTSNPPTYSETLPIENVNAGDCIDIVRSLIANLRATAAIDYEPILRDTFYLNNRGKAILYVAPTEGSLMKGVEEIKEVREDFNATPTVLFIGNNNYINMITIENNLIYNNVNYTLHALMIHIPRKFHYIARIKNHRQRAWYTFDDSRVTREKVSGDYVYRMNNIRMVTYIRSDRLFESVL